MTISGGCKQAKIGTIIYTSTINTVQECCKKIISGHVTFFGSERCHFNHGVIFESVVSGVVMIGGLRLNGISTVSNVLSTPMRRTQ